MKRSPELRPNPWDGVVALLVLLLAMGCGMTVWGGQNQAEQLTVVVSVDGEEVERIKLDDSGDLSCRTYSGNGYTLVVDLRPDGETGVRVEHSDCPSQDCVHTGTITRSGQSIVCLPARIIIQLEGAPSSGTGPDIVIG